MTARIRFAVLAFAALLVLPGALRATDAIQNDLSKQKQTISDIRNVGTAMWVWYKDQVVPRRSEEAHKKAEAEAQRKSADISAVPVISREELAKLLVPKYIASIPEKDGWGNPYEFHLNTTDPNAVQVMALRSPGLDGSFSGSTYVIGPFAPDDQKQDIAWMDGYFIHWPQPSK
jgi:type II secretory pathway pseudopilin PulG